MPILAVLDESAFTALDDSLKTLYKQNTENRNYYLDISPDEAGKVAFGLQTQLDAKKTELTKKHTELNELKAKVNGFDALGKTPEEISAALAAKTPTDVKALEAKHQTDLENLRNSFTPITAANEKLKEQVQRSLTDATISKLTKDFDLDPEVAPAILRDYIRAVPKAEGSDEYVTQIFVNGEPALATGGTPMNAEQLIKSFQEGKKFSGMFQVGNGAGGGPIRNAQHVGSQIVLNRDAVKNNPSIYENAKAEAAKTGKSVVFQSKE